MLALAPGSARSLASGDVGFIFFSFGQMKERSNEIKNIQII